MSEYEGCWDYDCVDCDCWSDCWGEAHLGWRAYYLMEFRLWQQSIRKVKPEEGIENEPKKV